jgi:AraC-like DNA-binding protein
MVVEDVLTKLGLNYAKVELGTVEGVTEITDKQRVQLKEDLKHSGLELQEDRKDILIEKIKNVIIKMIHSLEELPAVNYSYYISDSIGLDYTYLANTFSTVKGVTIQQYIIKHKIEKVKELLLFGEMNLTEISYKLNYSSVAHLSGQFKKVTGVTPSDFRQMHAAEERIALEDL